MWTNVVSCLRSRDPGEEAWPCRREFPTIRPPFERTSKRRRGFPSETQVKRGERIVNGDKELVEKLGRNDPCPCGSGRRFQEVLHKDRNLRRVAPRPLLLGIDTKAG
jgi:hypothetical protein